MNRWIKIFARIKIYVAAALALVIVGVVIVALIRYL